MVKLRPREEGRKMKNPPPSLVVSQIRHSHSNQSPTIRGFKEGEERIVAESLPSFLLLLVLKLNSCQLVE